MVSFEVLKVLTQISLKIASLLHNYMNAVNIIIEQQFNKEINM